MNENYLNLNEWLESINEDGKIHHIGEYYAQRYGKPFHKKLSPDATVAFKTWWYQQAVSEIEKIVTRAGFEILRDTTTFGFFVQKKTPSNGQVLK